MGNAVNGLVRRNCGKERTLPETKRNSCLEGAVYSNRPNCSRTFLKPARSKASRKHLYDIKQSCEEIRLEGPKENCRRKPCIKNRVGPEVEEVVVKMAHECPARGRMRVLT